MVDTTPMITAEIQHIIDSNPTGNVARKIVDYLFEVGAEFNHKETSHSKFVRQLLTEGPAIGQTHL